MTHHEKNLDGTPVAFPRTWGGSHMHGSPMPAAHLERYLIGFENPDGSRTTTEVEAFSEDNAEEKAKEYLNETVVVFAEKIEEPEEPGRPIVM